MRWSFRKYKGVHSSIAGITFHNVCFSYPSRPDEPVLKVSMEDILVMYLSVPTILCAGY